MTVGKKNYHLTGRDFKQSQGQGGEELSFKNSKCKCRDMKNGILILKNEIRQI